MYADQLEYMSIEEGGKYNDFLMQFCTGKSLPNRQIPVQWIMFELWKEMRDCDQELANVTMEHVFTFMRAQTSRERLSIKGLHQYLNYRQGDVGQAYDPLSLYENKLVDTY